MSSTAHPDRDGTDPLPLLTHALTAPANPRETRVIQAANRELEYRAHHTTPPQIDSGLTPRFLASLTVGASLNASHEADGALVAIRLHDRGDLLDAAEEPGLTLVATSTRRVITALSDRWDVTLTSDGPDLLVVLLPRHPNPGLAATLSLLSEHLAAPVPVPGWLLEIEAGIGVTPLDPSATPAELIAQARRGLPDRVHLRRQPAPADDPGYEDTALSPLALVQHAWDAIDHGRLTVAYQVVSQTNSPGIVGTQAIPGWIDTHGTHHTLAELGDLASITRLAYTMIEHTVADTCTALASWTAQLRPTTPFARIDLPAPLLRSQRFCSQLHDLIDNSGIASLLLLGIPAPALTHTPDIDKRLNQLTSSGARLALTHCGVHGTPADALTRADWAITSLPRATFELLRHRDPDSPSHIALILLLHTARKLDIPVMAEETDLGEARLHLGTAMFTPNSRIPPMSAHHIADDPTWTSTPPAKLLTVTETLAPVSTVAHLPQPRDISGTTRTKPGW
ncbi:EAL domain-containing protein [Amycolatopsis sp. lyj-112]|uniref:EAL domain-containing protein n=1 Tax=Amycolatopsis sp. lyj-112 TaxID=2789288 RepID=UPI00397B58C4